MSTVQAGDVIAVYRGGTLYHAPADMSTVQDTDLLVIGRGNTPYKCTFADWKASQVPPVSVNKPRLLTPADGAGQVTQAASSAITKVETLTTPDYSADLAPLGGSWDPSRPLMNAFDGDEGKFAYVQPNGGSEAIVFDPQAGGHPIHLGAAGVFTFKGGNGGANADVKVFVNGADVTSQVTPAITNWRWYTVPVDGGVLYSFKIQSTPGAPAVSYGAVLHGMRINGVDILASAPVTKLTLTDATGLSSFSIGEAVTEGGNGNDGKGSVVDFDATAKTMQLSGVTGTWDVGSTVLGAPKLSTDAAVGETPTFTSTAFAITGTGVTHASSDWQVTLKADTTFASPVVQSMADATNLVSWAGGPLQADTDYIARVRHNGSGGLQSAWSDVISFKTKAAFIQTLVPSAVWKINNTGAIQTKYTSPSPLISMAGQYHSNFSYELFAAGVDGKFYAAKASDTALSAIAVTVPAGASSLQAVACNYRKDTVACLWDNGGITVQRFDADGVPTQVYADTNNDAVRIANVTSISNVFLAIAPHEVRFFGITEELKVSITLPAGESVKAVVSYDAPGARFDQANKFLVQTNSGKLFRFGSRAFTGGTQIDTDVVSISAIPIGAGSDGGYWVTKAGALKTITSLDVVTTSIATGIADAMQTYVPPTMPLITLRTDGLYHASTKITDPAYKPTPDLGMLPVCQSSPNTFTFIPCAL